MNIVSRRKIAALFVSFALFTLPALSQPKVVSKTVSYQNGSDAVNAILYSPAAAKGKLPAIVVIHDWHGLTDWAKERGQGLAAKGYVALAVDLYRGKIGVSSDEASALMKALPHDRAVGDLLQAVAFLKAQANVDSKRIGCIGWSMGGSYTALLAVAEPSLRAVVINYGDLPSKPEDLKKIHARVMGNFAGQDTGITADSIHQFENELKANGNPAIMKIYPQAEHGFFHSDAPADVAAAKDAVPRVEAFLSRELK